MNINNLTEKLISSRLMQTDEEFEVFEQTILDILELNDMNHIKNLCMGFHDETECHDVMFGLMPAIDSYDKIFDKKECLKISLNSIHLMLPHAKEWARLLNIRILNSKNHFEIYKEVISELDNETKNIILDILVAIKEDDSSLFAKPVNEVLEYVKTNKS